MIAIEMGQRGPRQPGLISILVASRHRRAMLQRSIGSLRANAVRPDLVELLVAHDPDDPGTRLAATALGASFVWCAPKRYGYAGAARYYAALLEQACGEWILPSWGDDGIMLTRGWDETVRNTPAPAVLYTTGGDPWGNNCFPIVHADVFAYTGRFPDLPAIDTWYDDVGKLAGIHISPNPAITLMQDRFDITGNNDDDVYRQGRSGYRAREFYSQPYTDRRSEDALAIRAALKAKGFVHAW